MQFEAHKTYMYVVQAYLEERNAWLTITMPSSYLGNLQTAAQSFANAHEVTTRIKSVEPFSAEVERLSEQIKVNRGVFEPDGYHKHLAFREIKRDSNLTEEHFILEDVE